MVIRGVIFDLDGVIISTDSYHYMAWKQIADEMGVFFDENINHRLRGVSRMESLEIILEQYQGPALVEGEKQKIAERKNMIYRNLLGNLTTDDVSVEVKQTLARLSQRGYQLAIGSSSKNAKFILKKIGLFDAFEVISDGTNIERSKPDPEVFLKAADLLGLIPQECAVIEDADAGIRAAKSGKMTAIALGKHVTGSLADYHIQSFAQLSGIL